MKTSIAPLKRILAFLLILATICSVFASCASDESEESNSDALGSGISTDENGNTIIGSDFSSDGDIESSDAVIPIFANGAYTAKLIRGDMANAFEKDVYTKIRNLLKTQTGVNPEFTTDFVPAGEEKYDGPAILIGETTYKESQAAYKKLGSSEASATISGNKYVIAVSSADAFDKLLTTLKGYLTKKATKTEINIDSSWKISAKVDFLSSGNETFDETGLIKSATLPNLGTGHNSGQGSKTYIKDNANKSTFETLCKDIEAKGLKKYTTNAIGDNLFATYVTQTQIVHVMFFPNKNQIRTAVDKRGVGTDGAFALTGLSGENKYKKTTDSEMIVCDISNADWPGGMCIIYKLADGRFFIVDSGIGGLLSDGRKYMGSSSGWIYATLAKHAADPKNIEVAAWLITHVHSDHAGGLFDMALGYYGYKGSKHTVMPKEIKQYIKIDKLIYNSPDNLPDCNREHWVPEIIKQFNIKEVVKAHPGQVFYFADLSFTVYGSLDLIVEQSGIGNTNHLSLCIKVDFNGKTALLMGDSEAKPAKQMALIYKNLLKSDILQLAHHGYGGTGTNDVNSYCNPSIVLWVVSNADLRSNYTIDVNTSIATLKNVKNYKPGTGNLIFRKDWSTYADSRNTMVDMIPTCDGTHCGNKNCGRKTSSKSWYA